MSKSPCFLLNNNINFNENKDGIRKTESKMENSTHNFRETNLVIQLILESKKYWNFRIPTIYNFAVI